MIRQNTFHTLAILLLLIFAACTTEEITEIEEAVVGFDEVLAIESNEDDAVMHPSCLLWQMCLQTVRETFSFLPGQTAELYVYNQKRRLG